MVPLAIIAGAFGFYLRRMELYTVFEPHTGLAVSGAPVSLALMALSGGVILLLFGLSFLAPTREGGQFETAFRGGIVLRVLLAGISLAIIAAAGMDAFGLLPGDAMPVLELVWAGAGVLSGICLLLMALLGMSGKPVASLSVIPVFWLCLWHIVSHIENAANPTLLAHAYRFFALAFLLLGLYYIAGFAFGQTRVRRFLFTASAAGYFVGVTMADSQGIFQRVILAAVAGMILIYALILTHNLGSPMWESGSEDVFDEDEETDD